MTTPEQWTSLGATITAIVGFAFGIVQTWRKKSGDDMKRLVDVKDEIIRVEKDATDAWRKRYESEHSEFSEYRTSVHDRLNKTQELVLRLTNENGELRAKTDITPILVHQKEQSAINVKMIQSLDLLVERLVKERNTGTNK